MGAMSLIMIPIIIIILFYIENISDLNLSFFLFLTVLLLSLFSASFPFMQKMFPSVVFLL